MIDFDQLAAVNIQKLGEDEADQWCERLFKFTPTPDESTSHLLSLFDFTRSLLRLKTIQTDVLIEELQTVGSRLDAVNTELDHFKSSPPAELKSHSTSSSDEAALADLREQLEAKDDQLDELQAKNRRLEESSKAKERELSSVRLQLEASQLELREMQSGDKGSSSGAEQHTGTSSSSALFSAEHLEDQSRQLEEKNAQIEQLLDRLYDTDRINLDLAEQVAKLRLDVAKLGNEQKISLSQVEMLTVQVDEFRRLNESLSLDRDRKEKEIAEIRTELEHRSAALLGPRSEHLSETSAASGVDVSTNFFQELSTEIKRQQVLLEAKETEIGELRAALSQLSATEQSILEQKRDEVERLEAELAIVSSSPNDTPTPEDGQESPLVRQLRRRVRKLRKEKLTLLERVAELEKEAGRKDEHLETVRRQTMALMAHSGDHGASLKTILEENAVLRRMIVFRDDKIRYLIDQLNRHHLTSFTNGETTVSSEKPNQTKSEIPIMDQLIAITVERDVQTKQLDALQMHMSSVQKENLELQLGMKEILDGLRAGDTTADLVIECPSLERLCLLLENRLIYPALGFGDDSNSVDLSKVILLKSELDFVRGQNEQLRTELKTLRADFLAVIDEYTNDILENWTVPQSSSISDVDSSQALTSAESQNTDNQAMESMEQSSSLDDSKSDLLQAYYQQLKQFQLKSTADKRKPVLKKQKFRPKRPHSFNRKNGFKIDFSTQTEIDEEPKKQHHSKPPIIIPTSSVSTQTPVSVEPIKVADPPLSTTQQKLVLSESDIKKQIIDDISLGESLLADPDIQNFILSNSHFVKQVIETNAEVKCTLIQDSQIVDALLKDSRVQRVLHEEKENKKLEKSEVHTPDGEDDEYVEMFDISTQTVKPKFSSLATQTENIFAAAKPLVQESSLKPDCVNCSKYHQMLTSIRGLIDKERRQMKFQEAKLSEQIESLKGNLKLVTTEFQLDLEARAEEISDLRMKLRKSSERLSDEDKSSQGEYLKQIPKNIFTANLELSKLIETYPSFIEIESTEKNRTFKVDTGAEGKATKSILETIIACLQNCLKQKDEALAEYRQLLESMRQSATTTATATATTTTAISIASTASATASATDVRPSSTPQPNELETLYQELFLKPCTAQNEELLSLLSKTFAELNSLRATSKSQQEHLQSQLDTARSSLASAQQTITQLHHTISKLTTERNNLEFQIKSLTAKESTYISQISTLNSKIAELNKRSSALSASSLKKKVDNAVFQESADLRQQIAHLTEETKRLELERWTAEKKLNAALATARSKLADRDHLVASLNSQIEKYQSVLTKLEKKLQTTQRQVVREASSSSSAGSSKKVEVKAMESKETQTTAKVRDRSERPRVRFEDETTIHTEQRTVVVQRHQTQAETEMATVDQREHAPTDEQTTRLIEELQSMLQAALQREKMATVVREISAVGEDILGSTTSHVVPAKSAHRTIATATDGGEGGLEKEEQSSQTANSFLSFSDVYEQLIDMQFERLVSENAALKIKLKMAELAATTTTSPIIAVQ